MPFLLVVLAGVFAWWGVWRGEFLFDDQPAIEDNLALQAGDWWRAAFGEPHQPLANRPLTCLSLVIDLRLFGPGPFGPHLTNLLLHLGNALLLLATLRRVLLAPNLAGRFTAHGATALATAVAAIWVVHPLAADAVAYATQRSALLFSGCLLLALYATLRARAAAAAGGWSLLALLAVVGGMASKEDFVVVPLLLVLFERAFLVPSWSHLRRRLGWFLALAGTWSVLAICVALGPENTTVGHHTDIAAHEWLMTQAGVIAQYLRLSLWPAPLRGAYDLGIVRVFADCMVPGLVVVALLAASVACWRRWPWWGWLGALFFLLLAPTSTVLPIVTEVAAERRAYLPMLLPLVAALVAGRRLLHVAARDAARWLGPVAVVAVALALALVARQRVAVYAQMEAFWADAYAKRDPTSRSFLASQLLGSHAAMLCRQGRFEEANVILDLAMQCERPSAVTRTYHAMSLQRRGDSDAAIAALRQTAREYPGDGLVQGELGGCLMQTYEPGWTAADPRLVEAEAVLRRAVAILPGRASYWNSLGNVLTARGRIAEAEQAYRRATELTTEHPQVYFQRAALLQRLGRADEIAPMFVRLLAARPRDVELRLRLAEMDVGRRDFVAARALLTEVLRLDPQNARAIALQRQCESGR